jgi:hypothetical protein
MNRLGENVFQFGFSKVILFIPVGGLCVGLFFFFGAIDVGDVGFGLFFILVIAFCCFLCKPCYRYCKNGVVLDKDKGIIILYKFTLIGPQKFEEIQISEIMGVNRDISTTTTTEYVKGSGWKTTSSHSYNIVLQGKFGSRRFTLTNQDDWNLFMTLLYGE